MADRMEMAASLREAFIGMRAEDWQEDMERELADLMSHTESPAKKAKLVEAWRRNRAIEEIVAATPLERLEVYLEWNGILGYSEMIYYVATVEF